MLWSAMDNEGSGGALPLRALLKSLSVLLLPYAELSSELFPVILDADFSLLGQKKIMRCERTALGFDCHSALGSHTRELMEVPTLALCDLPTAQGRARDWNCGIACQY